jgi:myo-inositol-1(or 4)-monophosphatase
MRNELFSAAAGSSSLLNGQVINVSQVSELDRSIVSMDWSRGRQRRQALISALGGFAHQAHTIRSTGSASLSLAWVAAGRFDVYLNFGIGPWDVAAALVIIGQAGGLVTNTLGQPWMIGDDSCVASNGLAHSEFMARSGILSRD